MSEPAKTLVFRLPRSAYLAVLFLALCVSPLALADNFGEYEGDAGPTWRLAFFVIPLLAIGFIARTATVVSADSIRVRAVLGSRTMPWSTLEGFSVTGRAIYAVQSDGSVRLPCVRTDDLAAIARVSGGRLPEVRDPVRKFAPSRRRR